MKKRTQPTDTAIANQSKKALPKFTAPQRISLANIRQAIANPHKEDNKKMAKQYRQALKKTDRLKSELLD